MMKGVQGVILVPRPKNNIAFKNEKKKDTNFHAFRRWLKRDFIFYKGCENQKDTKAIESQYFAETQVSFQYLHI